MRPLIKKIKKSLTYFKYYLNIIHYYRVFENWLDRRSRPEFYRYYDEYKKYLNYLFAKASEKGGFDYLLTLLRVSGITCGHWDPFVEADEALNSFSKVLRKFSKKAKTKDSFRLALLIYCHATEMSAPYEIIANILRIINGKNYQFMPFFNLTSPDPNHPFKRKQASVSKKISRLGQYATQANEKKIIDLIYSFLRHNIRNAFYHSDYTITDDEFRILGDGSIPEIVKLTELSDLITRCFAFYSAFFHTYNGAKKSFLHIKKFHIRPNFQVLELLTDKKEGLYGFKMHHSTGACSSFERKKYIGTTGLNLMCEEDGLSFFIGDFSQVKNTWMVNNNPFFQAGTRYNPIGKWMPIVYPADPDPILKDIASLSADSEVQAQLFYMKATGHKAIEFVIRSNKPLSKKIYFKYPKYNLFGEFQIELHWLKHIKTKSFIYDCTIFLETGGADEVLRAIKIIKRFALDIEKIGIKNNAVLKYSQERKLTPKPDKNGRFIIQINMNDPRNTMCVSNIRNLPRVDWNIKEEWVRED